jgi:parallel beta-helix repeat protein
MSLTKVSYSMIQGAVFNVLDYGADPTGSADSTSAIQAAINAAQNGVSTVYFPAGTYKTTGSIVVNRTVNLVGAGAPCTTIKPTAGLTGPCIRYGVIGDTPRPGSTACEITGLDLDGTDTIDANASGIVTWCSHLDFHNNTVQNFSGYGIYCVGSWSNSVRNNFIYNNTKTNIVLEATCNAFVVDSNYILQSGEHGIWLQGCNKAVVTNNDLETNTGNGIKIVQSNTQAMRDVYVANNYFELNNSSSSPPEDIFVDEDSGEISNLVIADNYHETVAKITITNITSAYVANNARATLYFTNFDGSNVTTFNQPLGNYDTIVDNLTYSSYVAQDRTDGYQVFGRIAKFRVFSKNAGVTNEIFNVKTAGSNAAGYLGGSLQLKKIAAADAQTDSIYISVADGKLYFKDAAGISYALY